jgi:hypothetical protein
VQEKVQLVLNFIPFFLPGTFLTVFTGNKKAGCQKKTDTADFYGHTLNVAKNLSFCKAVVQGKRIIDIELEYRLDK